MGGASSCAVLVAVKIDGRDKMKIKRWEKQGTESYFRFTSYKTRFVGVQNTFYMYKIHLIVMLIMYGIIWVIG